MGRRSDPSRRALGACSLAVAILLVSAASAMGQAAIDQYVPSAKPGGHHGDPADAIREATETSGPGNPASQAKAKKKKAAIAVGSPGAGPPSDSEGGGYPLTTFVIVVLLLFLLGLAARYVPDLVRRLRLRLAS